MMTKETTIPEISSGNGEKQLWQSSRVQRRALRKKIAATTLTAVVVITMGTNSFVVYAKPAETEITTNSILVNKSTQRNLSESGSITFSAEINISN